MAAIQAEAFLFRAPSVKRGPGLILHDAKLGIDSITPIDLAQMSVGIRFDAQFTGKATVAITAKLGRTRIGPVIRPVEVAKAGETPVVGITWKFDGGVKDEAVTRTLERSLRVEVLRAEKSTP